MASKALLTKVGPQKDLPVGIYRRTGRRGDIIGYQVSVTVGGVADLIYISVRDHGEEGALKEALKLRAKSIKGNHKPKHLTPELVIAFQPLREAGLVYRGNYSGGYSLLTYNVDRTPITVLWRPGKKSLKELALRCVSKGAVLKPFNYDLFESKFIEVLNESIQVS